MKYYVSIFEVNLNFLQILTKYFDITSKQTIFIHLLFKGAIEIFCLIT